MPLGGPPLTPAQVGLIRTWIREGAAEDSDTTPKYQLDLPSLQLDHRKPVRIRGRVPTASYVELELSDSHGRTLYREGGAVKRVRDQAAIAVPGEWIAWDLRRASDWPAHVRARLTIAHAASEPLNAVIAAAVAEFPPGESEIRILAAADQTRVLHRREHLPGGLSDPKQWNKHLTPGLYVLHVRQMPGPAQAAILFRVH